MGCPTQCKGTNLWLSNLFYQLEAWSYLWLSANQCELGLRNHLLEDFERRLFPVYRTFLRPGRKAERVESPEPTHNHISLSKNIRFLGYRLKNKNIL